MTGRVTSSIAFIVASGAGRFSVVMMRSTFSSTTIASSTTMPIASTMPNSVNMLIEKPNRNIAANVPISDTGTASIGMMVARQFCRNSSTTQNTRIIASISVLTTSLIEIFTYCSVSYGIVYAMPLGKSAFSSSRRASIAPPVCSAFAPGCRKIAIGTVGWPLSFGAEL